MRLDPFAFRWASKPLRADKAFVLEALGLTSRPFELKRFVSHSLREDEDVLAIFGRNARDSIAAVPTGSSVEPVPVVSEEVASEDGEELESLDGALSELEVLDATASEPGPASRSLAAEAASRLVRRLVSHVYERRTHDSRGCEYWPRGPGARD